MLAAAARIFPSTERLSHLLASRIPSVAAKLRVLPRENEPDESARRISGVRPSQLLIVGDDSSVAVAQLIGALAAALRQIDAGASAIVDGALADDLATMSGGDVFVLGRGSALRATLCHADIAAVLFPSRRWGMGDARVDEIAALGFPTASFDPSISRSRVSDRDLLLSPTEPPPTIISALIDWWRNLPRRASLGA